MTILGDLFFGNLTPPVEGYMGYDREYSKLSDKTENERNHFKEMLSDEDSERYDKMFELYNKLALIEVREGFIYGFKLAVKMMGEAYSN